jgi:hypothetical protein
MAMMSQMPMSNVMCRDSVSLAMASNPLYEDAPKIAMKSSNNRATHHAGVVCRDVLFVLAPRSQVPVKVEMVESGSQFKFERLLVLNQPLTLSVEVHRPQ